ARAGRGRRAGRPAAARGAARDARGRQPLRPRQRHAGAHPQHPETLARGARMKVDVDGVAVELAEGARVLDAARAAGRWGPTLCWDDRLAPFGACRVCLVAADGRTVAACTTPARDGMHVETEDPTARRIAANVVELVLSELPEPPAPHTE